MKDGAKGTQGVLSRLWEVAALLAHEEDPRRLVPLILDQAIELVGAERGFIILLVGAGAQARFDVAAARNIDREGIQDPEFKVSRSIVQRVVQTGNAELISDAAEDAATREIPSVRALNLRSILCVPLRAYGHTLGVVYVDHRYVKGEFDPEDLATLRAFAVPSAIALDAAWRLDEMRKGRDELARRVETIERLRIELAERYRERSREANRLREEAAHRMVVAGEGEDVPGVVARSAAMKRVLALARKAAAADAPVLIAGESGVGKEVVARAIHALSPRRSGPFVAENCAAFAETLLESELFGHVPGAFTGALKAHQGLFETARGGTVLLDEVGEMSPGLQAKLLRVLEERAVRPVGGEKRIAIDVRVIAASHRDLPTMVAEGTFRGDLYYRLNVVRVEIPPLRERLEDVPALIEHFLLETGSGINLEGQTRELLLSHSWPGNVRELRNEMQRLAVMAGAGGVVRPSMLSPAILGRSSAPAGPAAGPAAGEAPIEGIWHLEELEREMIQRALRRTRGNKTYAARLLGIPKTSLYNRLQKHGLAASGSGPALGESSEEPPPGHG